MTSPMTAQHNFGMDVHNLGPMHEAVVPQTGAAAPHVPPVAAPEPVASLLFNCPTCHRRLRTELQFAGRRARCSGCGATFSIPNVRTHL